MKVAITVAGNTEFQFSSLAIGMSKTIAIAIILRIFMQKLTPSATIMLSGMISIRSCRPFSFSACLRMSSEICTFVKCIVCIFSGLVTPKLQTSGLTRKGRPFFTAYQTHFLRQYHSISHNLILWV